MGSQEDSTVMLIGFQCSESPGPTGGELSGSLGNSMGPDSPVKKMYFFLILFYFLNFIEC